MPVKKPSNPPNPLPASIAVTPPPPPGTLVEHLHRSFKSGACADVRLWVRKWGVGWHVHKMVLVQAGFFHSLFMGAFSENAPGSFKAKGKGTTTVQPSPDDDWTGEDIELTFDDPNITRAAFEICLSRLYSPYPLLHFPLSLLPTASQPLTPSYPPTTPFPSLQTTYHSMAQNNHLVSPRLLLSLLATATYLGQQYLLREVLAIVLRTVGPATVGRYLSFAIGNGVGEEEWTGQDDEGAYGLETIARTMSSGFTAHAESDEWVSESDEGDLPDLPGAPPGHRMSTDSNVDDVVAKVSDVSVSRSASIRSSSTLRPGGSSVLVQVDEEADANLPPLPHFYGFVSNKLGEACVCWLSRWGLDTLNIEAALPDTMAETDPYPPPVWGQGGIPANFVAALLSSDALFVPNEMERYRMARQVLDLRRAGWTAYAEEQPDSSNVSEADSIEGWDEDERELSKVFAEGIYYSHMTFDDLSSISSDVDPTTALPYAPLSVLQAAHWSAADLKNRVLNEKVPASALEGELGLTQSTTDLCAVYARRRAPRRAGSPYDSGMRGSISFSSLSLGTNRNSGGPAFHPVPSDDTHRIGAGGLLFFDSKVAASAPLPGIPGLPDHGPEWGDETTTKGKARPPPQNESTFFGVIRGSKTGPEIEDKFREDGGLLVPLPGMDKSKEDKWSKMEPFRFSVEFWGVDKLAEKERLYSQTHFYAGSYFNVYVSTIRKKDKGVQLGIYLHRQSPTEPFPSVSTSPVGVSSTATGVTFHSSDANSTGVNSAGTSPDEPNAANPMASTYSLVPPQMASVYRTMSISPPQLGSPPAHHDSLSDGEVRTQTSGGYLDPRRVTKAYFSISCASALGTALVRFSSAPDSFALSQSWGWKSSALRSEEYLSVPIPADKEGGESTLGWVGESPEGGSLRATVVVGVI
ncbi:hypothetical protein Q8F55_004591 [Vanrija albida]|uniref:BTB domain-containing protein n=1 Tax=Vanrija albida TaxID=181172 RepID=A0ABR3Q7D0_9TREE